MRRVEYNDGEGLLHNDLNVAQALLGRNMGRVLGAQLWGADTTTLRLTEGVTYALSGTGNRVVTLSAGTYLQPQAAAGDEDMNFRLGYYAGQAFTLDAPTSGTVWRRDVIQAIVAAEVAGSNESRDFEDATSRALTSVSVPKRRISAVTLSVKKGTDQASETLADANEPAVDAGYTKVYSVLVPATGSVDAAKVWDWHSPIGHGRWFLNTQNMVTVGTTITMDTNPGALSYVIAENAVAVLTWRAPTIGSIGIRLLSASGNFSTKGDISYQIYFGAQAGGYAYDWAAIIAEGQLTAERSTTFNTKPVWATGEPNRTPLGTTSSSKPMPFRYKVHQGPSGGGGTNYFYGVQLQYVGC